MSSIRYTSSHDHLLRLYGLGTNLLALSGGKQLYARLVMLSKLRIDGWGYSSISTGEGPLVISLSSGYRLLG